MDLITSLDASGLSRAAEASAALAGGWAASPPSPTVSFLEINRIYALRQQHLLSRAGAHAAQLAASIGELLTGLRGDPTASGHWLTIRGNAEHHFLLLIHSETGLILGCLRVVGKPEVSDEGWQELWQGTA